MVDKDLRKDLIYQWYYGESKDKLYIGKVQRDGRDKLHSYIFRNHDNHWHLYNRMLGQINHGIINCSVATPLNAKWYRQCIKAGKITSLEKIKFNQIIEIW